MLVAGNRIIGNWLRRPKEADPNLEVEKVEEQPQLYLRTPKSLKKVYLLVRVENRFSRLWDPRHSWGSGT